MRVIPFPDLNRLLSRTDREAISQFAERFPGCNLEFDQQNNHDVAMLCINSMELCILCQKGQTMIVGINPILGVSANADTIVIAEATTLTEALNKLHLWANAKMLP
jgi:hypothetical protein